MISDEDFGPNLTKTGVGIPLGHPSSISSLSRLPEGFEDTMARLDVNRNLFAGQNASVRPSASASSAHSADPHRSLARRGHVSSSITNTATSASVSGSSQSYRDGTHRDHPSISSIDRTPRSNTTIAPSQNRATASSRAASKRPAVEPEFGPHNNWGVEPIDHFPRERMQQVEAKKMKQEIENSGHFDNRGISSFSTDRHRDERSTRQPIESTRRDHSGFSVSHQGSRYQDTVRSGTQPSTGQSSAGRPNHSSYGGRDHGMMSAGPPSRSTAGYDELSSRSQMIQVEVSISRTNVSFSHGSSTFDSNPNDWKDAAVGGKGAKLLRHRGIEYYYLTGKSAEEFYRR